MYCMDLPFWLEGVFWLFIKTEKGFVENNSVYTIDNCCHQFLTEIACMFCCIQLFCDPMDYSPPGSLSMGFSRQDYWSGLPCPPPGDLPDLGIESASPGLQADSLLSEPPGKPPYRNYAIAIFHSLITRENSSANALRISACILTCKNSCIRLEG